MDNPNSTNIGSAPSGAQTQNITSPEEIKAFRVEIDALMQKAENINLPYGKSPYILKALAEKKVFEHLTEAKMWLGKCLEASGTSFPVELADKAPKQE